MSPGSKIGYLQRSYSTIEDWCQRHKWQVTQGQLISLGKQATKISKQYGYIKHEVPHLKYKVVGVYHIEVLQQLKQPLLQQSFLTNQRN